VRSLPLRVCVRVRACFNDSANVETRQRLLISAPHFLVIFFPINFYQNSRPSGSQFFGLRKNNFVQSKVAALHAAYMAWRIMSLP
jgi:hypothetical protein